MQFIIDIIVATLSTYLAFTTFLAEKIESLIPTTEELALTEEVATKPDSFPSLPTVFNTSKIPDVLLKSREYQQASLAESSTNNTVSDPLSALVNIFCTFTTPTTIRTTTGTGFFVHSDGVILTNAHVAQYLLLGETELLGEAECLVRTGDPAKAEYKAKLLYIPPTWVQKNASLIDNEAPTGTGERDYALLYVSSSVTKSPLPARFPSLAVDTNYLPRSVEGSSIQAVGYPATDLIKNGANSPLIPIIATTTISELYTFGSNYADVFSIHGTNVGAEGSSGGPIVNSEGKVIGIIATRGNDETDGKGSLRAITLSHINSTIKEETGFPLESNISGNVGYRSQVFTKTLLPFLVQLLSLELKN